MPRDSAPLPIHFVDALYPDIYVDARDNVHVFLPFSIGESMGTDNTCQATKASIHPLGNCPMLAGHRQQIAVQANQ